jgi:PAS domain S-box-containing protein
MALDLLVIRDMSGRVLKASPSWRTVLGYEPCEVEGRMLWDFVHPDDRLGTQGSAEEVEQRKPGDPILGFINRYQHKNGQQRVLEWRAQRNGERIYGAARDVTDRIAAEKELEAARTAAEAASVAKTDFLANMSHEIRTPLNGVIGVVDALEQTELSPAQREMVQLIRESGVSLERLVSDILDVSKIEAGQVELEVQAFDLDQTLGACLDVARLKAEAKGLAFVVKQGAGAHGEFLGDALRLRQILNNLLSNAVKFTRQGQVTVNIGLEPLGQPVLVIAVEDTGVGFASDHAARLFDRFVQADGSITRQFGGTGLGLSICRSLTEMMGGEISARSTPGLGSTFTVRVPLQRAESGCAASPSPAAPIVAAHKRLRVLLAEDHPINQKVVQMILEGQDIDLVTVWNGAEAVEAVAEAWFDLILMDMQMPVMDGLSATRAIRALEAERGEGRTRVIMLSANAMADHLAQARAAGADQHLAKPITAERLLTGIETALAKA